MDQIAARLRQVRKARHRTMDSLSLETGYSTSYISRVERGDKKNPTVKFIFDVAENLGTTPAYLLGISDDRQATQER